MTAKERKVMEQALSALGSALNIEGPALFGAITAIGWKELNVPWHFAKIRKAMIAITNLGIVDR